MERKCFINLVSMLMLLLLPTMIFAQQKGEQEKTEKERWKSSLGISYVLISGNTDAETLSVAAEANRKGDENELELKAGTVYGKTEGQNTSNYWYGNGKYAHDISPKAYLFGLLGLEGNKLAGYKLRFSANTGIGYKFLEGTHTLKGEVGPGYIFEDRLTDDDLSFLSGRAYAIYKWQFTEQTSFSQDVEYLHDFDDADDYRFNTNTSLIVKLNAWISLKTGVSVQYVNKPAEGNQDTDVFTGTSLVLSF
jgi:putative salt-induced outer membrane protein